MSAHEPARNSDAVQIRKVRAPEVTRESMRLTLADPPERGWIASRRYYSGALDSAFREKR
jgi:hypothetical protein